MAQRNTWQRERVREALASAPGFVSAQSLHATLRDENTGIGLATVYRALADMAATGGADSLQSPEGESLYRACTTRGHHHHLICRSCGRAVEIAADDVEEWARRTAARHGFTQAEHVVDIFGLCEQCTAVDAASRRRAATADEHTDTATADGRTDMTADTAAAAAAGIDAHGTTHTHETRDM